MTQSHPVIVQWSDEKKSALPTSGEYITVARFEEDRSAWPAKAWSVALQIHGDVTAQPCRADARFLSQDAPHDRLRPGVRFELLEGTRVTAVVDVV